MEGTPLARFQKTFSSLMGLVGDVIEELHSDGLCTMNKAGVEIFKSLIITYGNEKIISAIAASHVHWVKVKKREESFMTVDLVGLLRSQNIAIDLDITPIIFGCYNKLKASEEWKAIPEENWPVCQEDIDDIWDYFVVLIRITCNWIHEMREPIEEIKSRDGSAKYTYRRPEVRKEIDLGMYEAMFDFRIGT